jgi:CBS domain-containing protein
VDIPLVKFSSLLRSSLVDSGGDRLGRVDDLIVRLADETYPPVTGLKARIGGREVFVPADRIASLEPGRVQLIGEKVNLGRFDRREGEVLLREDLLKRRMINVVGASLVRANDLVLGLVEGWWRVVGVDTHFRSSLLRRLPVSLRKRAAMQPFLDWSSVEPFVRHVPSARLKMGYRRLAKLHPAQIADLVEAASHDEGEEIIAAVGVDREFEADVFEELDTEHQVEFLSERSDAQVAKILGAMEADDAADLLAELDQDRREVVLRLLPWRTQRKVQALLGYNPATAGGLMSPDFIGLAEIRTVDDALAEVRRTNLPEESITTVFTLDGDNHLSGVISVVSLLKQPGSKLLADAKSTPPLVFETDDELSEIAVKMADYDLMIAPVVDPGGALQGIVSMDDLIEMMIPEDWRRRERALAGD